MMSIPVTELRRGTTLTEGGKIFRVLDYEHIKMGRGNATIKLKVADLRSGAIIEKRYLSGQKVQEALVQRIKVVYLYHDDQGYHFMDQKTYDQFSLKEDLITESAKFLKEGLEIDLLKWDDEPLGISLPPKLTFRVTQSPPGVRGDSATNVFKEVILENDLRIKAPLFIEAGEEVVVDTRTGEYVERARRMT